MPIITARAERWLELTEKTFTFATYAHKAFITAKGKEGLELKKEILLTLGKTPIIKDQILTVEPNECLVLTCWGHWTTLEPV